MQKLERLLNETGTEILKNIISGNEFQNIQIRCRICEELEKRLGKDAFDSFIDSII